MASEQRRRGPANRDPRVWQHHMRQGKQKQGHHSFRNSPIPFFPNPSKNKTETKTKKTKRKQKKNQNFFFSMPSIFFLLSVKKREVRANFVSWRALFSHESFLTSVYLFIKVRAPGCSVARRPRWRPPLVASFWLLWVLFIASRGKCFSISCAKRDRPEQCMSACCCCVNIKKFLPFSPIDEEKGKETRRWGRHVIRFFW